MSSYLSDKEIEELNLAIDADNDISTQKLNSAVIRQAAALSAGGASRSEIKKKFNLTEYAVKKLFKLDEFKNAIAEVVDDAIAEAKIKTRNDLSRMQIKAMKALEDNLDKKSLEAVKTWLRAVGMDQQKDGEAEDKGFTLVLASQPKPQNTIVVKKEGEE